MLLASLTAASFLVWRYCRQGPLLIQVAPETKAPPYFTALGVQVFQDPKIPMELSNMPKLLEHVQLLRPKAPPRIPSTCPELSRPKVNRYDVAKRVAQKMILPVASPGSCWYKESEKAGLSPKGQRDEAASRPSLQPKCPRDTMEAPPWPQAASSGEVKLFAPVGSQPTDQSPKELIRKNPNTNGSKWLFAEIVLDGRGEPQDYVPQRLTAHRVPKRVIFLPDSIDSIGRFPWHLERIPSLPKPSFEPPWPAKLQPKLWETGRHRAKLMTPPTPKQTPAPAPTRRQPRQPSPALPRLWPREGPWWTFGSSYKKDYH
eukprot:Skav207406  [mRNA]  locus=scaffold646:81075:82022:+ [translate_table: standard]